MFAFCYVYILNVQLNLGNPVIIKQFFLAIQQDAEMQRIKLFRTFSRTSLDTRKCYVQSYVATMLKWQESKFSIHFTKCPLFHQYVSAKCYETSYVGMMFKFEESNIFKYFPK